jgi:competence protein ComGC
MGVARNQAVAITVGGTILTDTAVLIILALILSNSDGGLEIGFLIRLLISLAVFSVIIFMVVPKIAKWFFKRADSEKYSNFGQHLYIGQDLKRSIDRNELNTKIDQTRRLPMVHGNCYWYGYQILDNFAGVAEILKNDIHSSKSLIPAYTHMHDGKPKKVSKISNVYTEDMHFLTWEHNRDSSNPETAQKFVIYRFRDKEKIDINRAENIVDITPDNFLLLPYEGGESRCTYVVTALDAFGNESKVRKIKVKL